jgi:pimeloyl-ACP methyl ester carboxylesterase
MEIPGGTRTEHTSPTVDCDYLEGPMTSFLSDRIHRRRLLVGAAAASAGMTTQRQAFAQATPDATPASPIPPPDLSGVTHRQVQANGIDIHIVEAGEGPVVLMVHGFPEIWYSWRHQLPALAAAGYHAVALDMRGCGESEVTESVKDYGLRTQMDDVLGVLDALEVEQAVLVGHDVGAGTTWALAELYPERIAAHATIGIAYGPRPPTPPTEMIQQFAGDHFNFALYCQEPGVADAEFEADVRKSLRLFMYAISGDAPAETVPFLFEVKPVGEPLFEGLPDPEVLPGWISEADLDVYTEAYERTGFTPALNGYRNFDSDWEELPEVGTLGVQQPALFVGGRRDPAVMYTLEGLGVMEAAVPNLRKIVLLPGCGHWAQQERPEEVNHELIDFLDGLEIG